MTAVDMAKDQKGGLLRAATTYSDKSVAKINAMPAARTESATPQTSHASGKPDVA